MARRSKRIDKKRMVQTITAVAVILLVLIIGLFLYVRFLKPHNYLIENKYYGFKLQTPAGWTAEEKTLYSEDKITQLLAECKNDKSTREIGAFRFKNQTAGIILGISVSCNPVAKTGEEISFLHNNFKFTINGSNAVIEKIIGSFEFIK